MLTPEEQKRIAGLRSGLHAEADRIRRDGMLSEQGRKVLMARAALETKKSIDGIVGAAGERAAARQRELRRSLFGGEGRSRGNLEEDTTRAIVDRDARDRAATIQNPAEAAKLLRRADEVADESLARAVAHHAYNQFTNGGPIERARSGAWREVLKNWAGDNQSRAEGLDELAAIDTNAQAANSVDQQLRGGLPLPRELRGLDTYSLTSLAGQEPPPPPDLRAVR